MRMSASEFFALPRRDQDRLLDEEEERERDREFNAWDALQNAIHGARKVDKDGHEYTSAEVMTVELLAALLDRDTS